MIFLLMTLLGLDHPQQLQFNLEMSIGSEEGDEHLIFSGHALFSVQPDGQLAVLDCGNKRLLLFSEKGAFLREAGGEGEGPGEFSGPSEITSDQAGNIYVFDAQALKINVYNSRGDYAKTLPLPLGVVAVLQPNVLPGGNLVFTTVQMDSNQQQIYRLALYNAQGEPRKTILNIPQPVLDWQNSGSSSFWVEFLRNHLEGVGRGFPLAASTGKGFVTLQTNKYSGSLWDGEGKDIGSFFREIRPRIMSDEIKQWLCEETYQKVAGSGGVSQFLPHSVFLKAMATADLPVTINPISALFSRGSGFGVLANYDPITHQGRVELFNEKGQYQQGGVFVGLASTVKWSQNKWYTLGENEAGVLVLSRYAVTGAMDLD